MTVQEWIQTAKLRLAEQGVESAGLEAQLLAAHVLLVPRTWLLAHPEEPFPDLAGESVLMRRLAHEPLAYILGTREFYGRPFRVGPGVLIPRQETEILVETALARIALLAEKNVKVLDLGTGSGCIAITLKLENPSLQIVASDISPQALAIAQENAEALGADVAFALSDAFTTFKAGTFDVIVTNPPYIGNKEPLAPELTDFEPHGALFAGPTGLEFYQRLAKDASLYLVPNGLILMEVGYQQAEPVNQLFQNAGWLPQGAVPDLSGVPRVVVCASNPAI